MKYALDSDIPHTEICKYAGYDSRDDFAYSRQLKISVDVLANLFSLGSDRAVSAICCFLGNCGRVNRLIYKLAILTRNKNVWRAVLEDACSGFVNDDDRRRAIEAIVETLVQVPLMRSYLLEAYGNSESYIQHGLIKNLLLFPHDMRLSICAIGVKSSSWDIRSIAEDYLGKTQKLEA